MHPGVACIVLATEKADGCRFAERAGEEFRHGRNFLQHVEPNRPKPHLPRTTCRILSILSHMKLQRLVPGLVSAAAYRVGLALVSGTGCSIRSRAAPSAFT